MNQNPYTPPTDSTASNVDPELTKIVASLLSASRNNPPTIASTLTKWPGTPKTVLIGAICLPLLFLIAGSSNSIPKFVPIMFSGMILGALLRDFGFARRNKKLWPVQKQFIDWDKVDELGE